MHSENLWYCETWYILIYWRSTWSRLSWHYERFSNFPPLVQMQYKTLWCNETWKIFLLNTQWFSSLSTMWRTPVVFIPWMLWKCRELFLGRSRLVLFRWCSSWQRLHEWCKSSVDGQKPEKHSLHVHAKDSSHTSILGTFAMNVDVLLLTAKHVNATPMPDEPRHFGWDAPVRPSPAPTLLAALVLFLPPIYTFSSIYTHTYTCTYMHTHTRKCIDNYNHPIFTKYVVISMEIIQKLTKKSKKFCGFL